MGNELHEWNGPGSAWPAEASRVMLEKLVSNPSLLGNKLVGGRERWVRGERHGMDRVCLQPKGTASGCNIQEVGMNRARC